MSSPPERPPKPTQIVGDYCVMDTIGKGTFGKVKKGVHIPTGEPVAIKVLNRQKLQSANMDKKIRREIKILKLFNHPNICRLYEVITTPTDIFLIMEYVQGGELYDFIVEQGKLSEDAARYVFQQIVCALEYCHHFRVVHRDLKPENILLGPNLQVKIIDFGLSNLMRDGEFLATSCGSPNYAAPEVISGKLYGGPEIDVWSCGCVLFALLCGCLPFDEETIPLLFAKIKRGRYTVPPHVPPDAKEFLDQLLVVDPLSRLTIPQIRDNGWFNHKLPPHLLYQDAIFASRDTISNTLVTHAAQVLKLTEDEVRSHAQGREGPGFVAYSILGDAKKRAEIASIGLKINSGSTLGPSAPLTAVQRELNLGLMLAASPAMNCLIDVNDAVLNKRSYNSAGFLPASVHDNRADPTGAGRGSSHSTSFGFLSVPNNSFAAGGLNGAALSSSLTQQASSLRSQSMGQQTLSSPQTDGKLHTGSVGKTDLLFTAEEAAFVLSNNYGWRLGIMSDQRSNMVIETIYGELKALGLEWKTAAQFKLLCRYAERTSSPASDVMIFVHVLRLQEKHDRGYLIDFGVLRGNTILALDLICELRSRLQMRIG